MTATQGSRQPIVVGVDGSADAAAALRWAMADECRRGRDVMAVLAWSFLEQPVSRGRPEFEPTFVEDDAREALDEFVVAAVGVERARLVRRRTVCDLPARALVELGREAELVVVGARGSGGFPLLRLGSTSNRLVEHAGAPVVLVRAGAPTADRIVVGVDGSETGEAALRWARDEARARSWPLQAVHAWQKPFLSERVFIDDAPIFDRFEREAAELLEKSLAMVDTHDVDLETTLVEGSAAHVLLDATADGALLVVGTRGVGAALGVLMGSITRQLTHHSAGPLVVVPHGGVSR
jgi:nucleotide-binding universal stress UspA family protein